jgi:hypothetical protein
MVGKVDNCTTYVRRLIVAGDIAAFALSEKAIDNYWAATPPRARRSGLLYIQQMLQEGWNGPGRKFSDAVDAFIQKKLSN